MFFSTSHNPMFICAWPLQAPCLSWMAFHKHSKQLATECYVDKACWAWQTSCFSVWFTTQGPCTQGSIVISLNFNQPCVSSSIGNIFVSVCSPPEINMMILSLKDLTSFRCDQTSVCSDRCKPDIHFLTFKQTCGIYISYFIYLVRSKVYRLFIMCKRTNNKQASTNNKRATVRWMWHPPPLFI